MTFREWIGLEKNLDYAKVQWLGSILGAAIFLIAVAVVFGGIATLVLFLTNVFQADANHESIRNIGLILVAVLGAPFVIWRAIVAQKQANTAEQSHLTDQINKAVAGLGADKVVNKIGRPVKIYMGKSRVWTQFSQHLIAKSCTIDKKLMAFFSNLVASLRISFILQKNRSTMLRMA